MCLNLVDTVRPARSSPSAFARGAVDIGVRHVSEMRPLDVMSRAAGALA
jgi:hypothetical protein